MRDTHSLRFENEPPLIRYLDITYNTLHITAEDTSWIEEVDEKVTATFSTLTLSPNQSSFVPGYWRE